MAAQRPRVPRRPREAEPLHDAGSSRSTSVGRIASGRIKRQQRKAAGAFYAQDEEGTEDVWKEGIYTISKNRDAQKGVEIDIVEDNSIDWKAERTTLPIQLMKIDQQHSFIPRTGELVLWCNNFLHEHYLMRDPQTNEFKFYSFEQKTFHGFPDWRAGVITQVPTSNQGDNSVDFSDILEDSPRSHALNNCGFRVETLPDPNNYDKSLSKQYRYVSLRHIRPMSHWQMVLKGIPEKRWHPSVKSALICMTSLSLVGKWKINGDWPHAKISCKACYIGSELITVGDTIRIAPSREMTAHDTSANKISQVTDILVVTSIRLNLRYIQEDYVLPESQYLALQSYITFVGYGFTLDARRDYRMPPQDTLKSSGDITSIEIPQPIDEETVKSLFRPVGTSHYGHWYRLQRPKQATNDGTKQYPGQRYEVSFDRMLGRLYEADAVRLWTGLSQAKQTSTKRPNLSYDQYGILAARQYATNTDERLPNPAYPGQINWHWTDTRVQALGLASVNGYPVAQYDDIRDPATLKKWRAQLKIIAGASVADYENEAGLKFSARGRKPGSRLINGRIVGPDEQLDSSEEGEAMSQGLGKIRVGSTAMMGGSRMANAAFADVDSSDMVEVDARGKSRSKENPHGGPNSPDTDSEREDKSRSSESRLFDSDQDEDDEPDGAALLSAFGAEARPHHRSRSPGSTGAERPRPLPSSAALLRPKSKSKLEIMTSVETPDYSDDGGDDGDEFDFLKEPVPVRGGTEESEGGDYHSDGGGNDDMEDDSQPVEGV